MPLHYKKNILHIDDVPLGHLAQRYGTPLYVYSATDIEEAYLAYDRALSRVMDKKSYTVCYALKANSNQAVLSLLQRLGAGADIVSGGELRRARRAGIPARKIVFSGVGKSDGEIAEALKAGIFRLNVESGEELEQIARIAKKLKKTAHVAFRVNPDVDAKTHAKISTGRKEDKFGIPLKDAPALYARAAKLRHVRADGIAVHIGSQLTSLAPFARAYKRLAALVVRLRRAGHGISSIDLGGGIGITYRDETPPDLNLYALLVRDIILPLGAHVVLEPGRSIVGNAGVLLSSVRHVKKGHGKKFMILDAGMNDLARPAMYDAYHAVLPCKKSARRDTYDVVGPVCETSCQFLQNARLPAVAAGDIVAIASAGAYGASMANTYNSRPLVAEAMVRGARHALIRRRQTIDEMIAADIVPENLS